VAVDLLLENDTFVDLLRLAIRDGSSGLSDVPMLLKNVLSNGRWRERIINTGQIVRFEHVEEFIKSQPLEGLGTNVDLIRRICNGDQATKDLLDQALQNTPGRPLLTVNNGNSLEARPVGNTSQYALRKLRNGSPELHAKVLAGELSPHRAMVQAGFRKASISIPADPADAGRRLARHFTPEQFVELTEAYKASRGV
jgi:hypothetical protein